MHSAAYAISKSLEAQVTDEQSECLTLRLESQLAMAIAQQLKLPTEAIGFTSSWASDHAMFTREFICAVNELFVVDVERVGKMVKRIYEMRYNLVHDAMASMKDLTYLAEKVISEQQDIAGIVLDVDRGLFGALSTSVRAALDTVED